MTAALALQLHQTVCAGELREVQLVFFLHVVRQEASGQEMLPRETGGALFGRGERDEHVWVDPVLPRLLRIPTWKQERGVGEGAGRTGSDAKRALTLSR